MHGTKYKKCQVFADFTIISVERKNHNYKARCLCNKCGKESVKSVYRIADGEARCDCTRYMWQKTQQSLGNNKNFLGCGGMPGRYVSNTKRRAKEKGFDFDLDSEYLRN